MKKIICPKCKSEHVASILYGYPSHEAFEMAEKGEILLGGCEVMPGDSDMGCLDCEYRWSKESLPASAIKKIRYKVWQNGPGFIDDMKTWVYEIYPDGKCVKYIYKGRNRHYVEREEEKASKQKTMAMFIKQQKFFRCQKFADIMSAICDGCSYRLQVTYADGRKRIVKGDVGMDTYEVPVEQFIEDVFEK